MWQNVVTALYPEALSSTICVPPVHFNRVPYARDIIPGTGQPVLVVQPPSSAAPVHNVPPPGQQQAGPGQYSMWSKEAQPQALPVRVQEADVRDDSAQRHVLSNLHALGEGRSKPMLILSQLNFSDYLSKPSYAPAAASLPTPISLPPSYRQGDFDVMVIHRHHGILIGELKSVGMRQANFSPSPAQLEANIARKVEQAVRQLDKSETVVRHLVSDVNPGLTVKKTLFLPYVSSAQLLRVLTANAQLEKTVRSSLGAANVGEAVQLCCCADQLSDPMTYWHVTPTVMTQLTAWWQRRVTCTVDPQLTDQLYLDIVSRFIGPATSVSIHCNVPPRVEVRTVGDAVSELGRRLSLLVLTLQQLDLLHRSPLRVCVAGPPGTGKTLMLVLQGLKWLLQGHDVHVISICPAVVTVSIVIHHQLQMTLGSDPSRSRTPGKVHLHQYNLMRVEEDVNTAVSDLTSAAQDGKLHVLMDEANFNNSTTGERVKRILRRLSSTIPQLHFWAARVFHTEIPPELQAESLTFPLRSAPEILREVQPGIDMTLGSVRSYSNSGVPTPGDGPGVVRLRHAGGGHRGQWPVDCFLCGMKVAAELQRLGVGAAGSGRPNSPPPLAYSDVFVLTRNIELHDDIRDDEGNVTSPASGVVQGLRAAGVPVCVLGEEDRRLDIARYNRGLPIMALARVDQITVAYSEAVYGLERKVVVWLPGRIRSLEEGLSIQLVEGSDRLATVSRCSTQLIVVRVPYSDAGGPENNNDDDDNDNGGNSSNYGGDADQAKKNICGKTSE
ncbi:uncharacterized protein [Littorina saxatilis]|uniref:Uncharacterized protein n=1 Tax=Littorina saxatilis TaxID=31220 RepID=A0AAN9G4P8_9CAEN